MHSVSAVLSPSDGDEQWKDAELAHGVEIRYVEGRSELVEAGLTSLPEALKVAVSE